MRAAADRAPALAHVWGAELDDHVAALRFAPDGSRLAAASVSGAITLLDPRDGRRERALRGHEVGTQDLGWSPDARLIASAGQDGCARIWEVSTGAERAAVAGAAGWVERVAWSPDGRRLAVAAGRHLRLADPQGRVERDWDDHPSTVTDIAWRPDGAELAATSYGGVTLWSPKSQVPRRRLAYTGSSLRVAWSPDGRYIATGDQDASVHYWIVRRAKDLQMSGYRAKPLALAWDARSRFLATSGGPEATVWDCSGSGPAGTRPLQLRLGDEAEDEAPLVRALAFQARGALLAVGDDDGRVGVFRPRGGSGCRGVAALGEAIAWLAWAPDEQALAVGTVAGTLALLAVAG